jgi:hypothetical protein
MTDIIGLVDEVVAEVERQLDVKLTAEQRAAVEGRTLWFLNGGKWPKAEGV